MAVHTHLEVSPSPANAWFDLDIIGVVLPFTASEIVLELSDLTVLRIFSATSNFVYDPITDTMNGTITSITRTNAANTATYETITGLSVFADTFFSAPSIAEMTAVIYAGADSFTGWSGNDTMAGSTGADAFNGGTGGTDFVTYQFATTGLTADLGTPANNTGEAVGDSYVSIEGLIGSAFADTLRGNSGDNTLEGGDGTDTLDGAGGTDLVSYISAGTTPLTVDLSNPANNSGAAAGETYISIEGVIGSAHSDSLRGDGGDNILRGGYGTDTMVGGAGNDYLYGGGALTNGGDDFRDFLDGGDGDDTLDGGPRGDFHVGGLGDDAYYLNDNEDSATEEVNGGTDTVFISISGHNLSDNIENLVLTGVIAYNAGGNSLPNIITGNSIGNHIVGNEGNDTLNGGGGDDNLWGSDGNDVVRGNEGNDSLHGDQGDDLIDGATGNDTLDGFFGNDTLIGGLETDVISGGGDNDIIYATHADGNDTISGGNGFDVLDFSQVNGVVQINQLAGTITGSAGNDTLLDVIEQIKGTNFGDVLSGGHGINVLDGEGGADQFFGNNGDDLMRGGTGDDTFFFSTSDGNDTLLGGDGFDILDYSSLAGVVQVNQLAGTTTGTANNDTLSDIFEQVIGTAFGDVLSGGHGINSLKGNGGDDQLFANNGDDYTSGGDGNDAITMGLGNDTHDFRNGEDVDTILDFTAGGTDDTVTLTFYSGLGSTSFDAAFQARLSTVSGHAELALNGGDRIIFNNVASHLSLTAADFIFA